MKKGVTFVIIGLFLGLLLTSTVNASEFGDLSNPLVQRFYAGDILYVGGSGPQNYSTIQEAVNNSYAGDTIFVYSRSSPYYENVIIKKNNIQLIEYPEYDAGVYLIYPSDHNNITDNIVINNLNGICLQASKNNTISKNIVSNNVKGLLIFADSVFNIISRNNVENNDYGFYFGFTVYNTIIENNIANSSECGLYLYFVRLQTIRRNNFINNTRHVYFIERLRLAFDRNYWIRNYWDTWIGFGPKLLKGQMFTEWVGQKLVPWTNFDWTPAYKPYTFQR
jgi:parallel beta-helix repeat protein